jgi:hypothetical protein
MNVGIPPRSRNHRLPATEDAPTATAASSLLSPLTISCQNSRSTSRRSDSAPGDFNGTLPVNSLIHPAGLPINTTSTITVLRAPVESALRAAVGMVNEPDLLHALPCRERHPQRVEDERCAHVRRELPAHDLAAEDIDHEAEEHDAIPAAQIREVRDPQLVRPRGREVAVDEVGPPTRVRGRAWSSAKACPGAWRPEYRACASAAARGNVAPARRRV